MFSKEKSLLFVRNDILLKTQIEDSEFLIVKPGDIFRQISENHFQINYRVEEDYCRLLEEISVNHTIKSVYHLWAYDCESIDYSGKGDLEAGINHFLNSRQLGSLSIVRLQEQANKLNICFPIYFLHYGKGIHSQLHNHLLFGIDVNLSSIIYPFQLEERKKIDYFFLNEIKELTNIKKPHNKNFETEPHKVCVKSEMHYLVVAEQISDLEIFLNDLTSFGIKITVITSSQNNKDFILPANVEHLFLDFPFENKQKISANLFKLRKRISTAKGAFVVVGCSTEPTQSSSFAHALNCIIVDQCTKDSALDFFISICLEGLDLSLQPFIYELMTLRQALLEVDLRSGNTKLVNYSSLILNSLSQDASREIDEEKKSLSELIKTHITKIVSEVLTVELKEISEDTRIDLDGRAGIRFDSMKLIEFTNRIRNTFGIQLSPVIFFQYPILRDLINFLEGNNQQVFEEYFLGR